VAPIDIEQRTRLDVGACSLDTGNRREGDTSADDRLQEKTMTRSGFFLIAAAGLSLTASACDRHTAPNIPPIAEFIFTPVAPIYAGDTPVVFNASGSKDVDGTVTMHLWNFGDGTPQQNLGASPVHIFPDTPTTCTLITYSVLLTVVDDHDAQTTVSHPVTVTELPDPKSPACQPSPTPRP
jgi:PKD repeat protein